MTIFLQRALALCLLTLFFGTFQGCTPRPGISPMEGTPPRDDSRAIDDSHAAQILIEKARISQGAQRNHYLLEATRQLIADQRFLLAEQTLANIEPALLDARQQVSVTLLSTEIALNQGRPRDALKLLQLPTILNDAEQIHLLKLRARAFLDAGYPFESAKSRVQLDQLLHDELEQGRNHQAIWETLSLLPQTSLQQISQAPLNPELLGWVELVKIAKRGQLDWTYLQDGIYQWRQTYPQHPATDVFSRELGKRQIELIEKPQQIAVLLPLSGSYAQLASAIRDGIMSAHYQHPDSGFKPRISFINTGDNQAAIWSYYQKATEQR